MLHSAEMPHINNTPSKLNVSLIKSTISLLFKACRINNLVLTVVTAT